MRVVPRALLLAALLGCGGGATSPDGSAGSAGGPGSAGAPGSDGGAGIGGAAGSVGAAGNDGVDAACRPTGAIGTGSGGRPEAEIQGTFALNLLAGAVTGDGQSDGSGTSFRFDYPYDLVYQRGAVYVADTSAIRKIDLATATMTTLAGAYQASCMGDGVGAAARFANVIQVVSGGEGILYALDWESDRVSGLPTGAIRRVEIDTGAVTTVAVDRPLQFAFSLAVDERSHAYLSVGNAIFEVDLDSGVSRFVAGAEGSSGTTDGVGADARFSGIAGMAVDADGQRLFVCNDDGQAIRAVDIGTGAVTTFANELCVDLAYRAPGVLWVGGGGQLSRFDLATGDVQRFPCGLGNFALDDMESVYFPVASKEYSALHRCDLAARTDTIVAGDPIRVQDGVGAQARFSVTPYSLAADGGGDIYIASSSPRRFDASTGAVTSFAPLMFLRVLAATPSGDILAATNFSGGEGIHPGGIYRLAGGTFGLIASHSFTISGLAPEGDSGTLVVTSATIESFDLTTGEFTNVVPDLRSLVATVSGVSGDGAGTLFLADATNCVVVARTPAGDVVPVAGAKGQCAFVDGAGTAARLGEPRGLSFDGGDSLYVLDGPTLRKVTLSTGAVVTLLGRSRSIGAQLGRPGGLYKPSSLAALAGGRIAIGDSYALLVATP